MTLEEAEKLNGEIVHYKNEYGVVKIGKLEVKENLCRLNGTVKTIKTVLINDLISENGVDSWWIISPFSCGEDDFKHVLSETVILEVIPRTKSMKFSYER